MKIKNLTLPVAKRYSRILLVVLLAVSCRHQRTDDLKSAAFHTNGGFGYTISIHGKTVIKQPFIPAIQGNIPFCDSTDALNTANFVIGKIKKEQSPTVTQANLAALKIKTKC